MRSSGAIAALLGLLPIVWAAACVRASVPPPSSSPPEAASTAAAPPQAIWDYHPPHPKRLRARLDLGPGVRLFVGDAGERWLVDARQGKAEAASSLADEDLVAVAQPSPGVFAFVGAGGTIYQSSSPLGPLSTLSRSDPPIWGTAAAGKLILGIRWDGTAVRSGDGGKTFSPVQGVSARILDVDVAPDGRAMMLGSPESLWISKDGAASFSRSQVEPVGAAYVLLEAGGSLVARGVDKAVIWPSTGEPEVKTVHYAIEAPALDLLTDVEPGPSARAVVAGRAAILDGRYYEAVPPPNDKGPWELASGGLAGRTQRSPIEGTSDCRRILVSGGRRTVALVCLSRATRQDSVLFPPLRLMVSRDAGTTFDNVTTGLVADEEDTHVAVSARGTFLITGACKPIDRGLCVPGAPMRLVPSPGTKRLRFATIEPSKLPPILGRTGQVRTSPDGKRLYATATLLPDRRPAVLISDDDGESFRAVPIDLPAPQADGGTPDGGTAAMAGIVAFASDALSVDESGRLSITVPTASGALWLVLDAQARLLSARTLPADYVRVSVVGPRGLALSPATGEVFESTDGGATFHPAGRLPKSESSDEVPAPVACVDQGCLVGDSFSRIGWGPSVGGVLAPAEAPPSPAAPSATPIVCEVQDGIGGDLPGAGLEVDAFSADRGDVAWSTYVVDRAKASVEEVHAVASPVQSVSRVTLLAPTTGEGVAYAVRNQAEGFAALRYRFARSADGRAMAGAPMRQVEIAWDHQLEGRVFRATIPDAGPLDDRDVGDVRKGEASAANIDLLSVSDDGIFVCPHVSCGTDGRDAVFADERGRLRKVRLPDYPSRGYGDRPLSSRSHVIRAGGADVFLDVILDSGAVLRERPSEHNAWRMDALSLLPTVAQANGFHGTLTWAYQGSALAGMLFTASHPSHPGFAELLRLATPGGVAAAEVAATQLDLGDPPRACQPADKKSAVRSVVPPQLGTRHPVIVHGKGGALYVLLTDYAIMYGPKGGTCTSTLDTIPSPGSYSHVAALLNASAMDRSWLFMPAPKGGLRWQGMRCHYEPGAVIPESRAPEPGPEPAGAQSAQPTSAATPPPPPVPYPLPGVPLGGSAPPGIPSAVWALLQSAGALSALPFGVAPPTLSASGRPPRPPRPPSSAHRALPHRP